MAQGVVQSTDPGLGYVVIRQGANRWNGSAIVANSGVTNFATGLPALTAVFDGNGVFQNQYIFTIPAALPASSLPYQVQAYGSNVVTDFRDAQGEFWFDGTGVVGPTNVAASTVVIVNPVNTDGSLSIEQGDEYSTLTITIEDYAGPSISGKTPLLRLQLVPEYRARLSTGLQVTGSVSMDGANAVFVFNLTEAITAALAASPPDFENNYVYKLMLDSKTTLIRSTATINADVLCS